MMTTLMMLPVASSRPGTTPAKNSATIEVSVTMPKRIRMMLGGMSMAMPPAVATRPADSQSG
jgi:hypothetical protein